MKVQQQQPGSTIKLAVMRDGKEMTVPVTVEQMGSKGATESANASNGKPRWGIGIGDLDPNTRQQIQAPTRCRERW